MAIANPKMATMKSATKNSGQSRLPYAAARHRPSKITLCSLL